MKNHKSPSECLWLIFKLIFMYFFVPWFKISKKLLVEKVFLKEKHGFNRGFIKGWAPGKLTGCEHDFAWLLYISKNFFLLQGTIKNSFKLQ